LFPRPNPTMVIFKRRVETAVASAA
jgi:hypothetical protein